MTDKPLFLPVKTGPFEDFKAGLKPNEYRVYGAGWNEHTCTIGREVVISKGYGKQNRLLGLITGFVRTPWNDLSIEKQTTLQAYFPNNTKDIAIISIEILQVIAESEAA